MTKEEAIFCEKSYIGETNCTDCKYYGTETCLSRESHRMAVKALEQEPCENCISFEAVKNTMFMVQRTAFISDNEFHRTMDLLMCLPPVQPKHTDAEIQKMQEMEQAEIQKAYELGKAEMQLSEDCISRQAAIEAILKRPAWHNSDGSYYHSDEIRKAVNELPPVTSQPKTGRWIKGKYRYDDIRYNDSSYKCNKCGRIVDFKENYCPNCGARMVEQQESEE